MGWSGRRGTDGEGKEKGKRAEIMGKLLFLRRCEKLLLTFAVFSDSERLFVKI